MVQLFLCFISPFPRYLITFSLSSPLLRLSSSDDELSTPLINSVSTLSLFWNIIPFATKQKYPSTLRSLSLCVIQSWRQAGERWCFGGKLGEHSRSLSTLFSNYVPKTIQGINNFFSSVHVLISLLCLTLAALGAREWHIFPIFLSAAFTNPKQTHGTPNAGYLNALIELRVPVALFHRGNLVSSERPI